MHTRNNNDLDVASKLPKQQTVLFNHWLSQVCHMLCKRAKDGTFAYYGCHKEYRSIQEKYSNYVNQTCRNLFVLRLRSLREDSGQSNGILLTDEIRIK